MDDKLRINIVMMITTAACIFFAIMPFSGFLIYPITLFVTYVHEMCHALVAILTGGSVDRITIHADGSGVTWTRGGIQWMVNFAGYLGTVLIGLFSIHLIKTGFNARIVLSVFLAIMGLSVVFTGFHDMFGTIWGLIIGLCLFFVITNFRQGIAEFVATFISIQLLLNAFYDLRVLFFLSGTGVHTDAMNMANETGIPSIFWACLWIGISVYTTYRVLFK